MKMNRKALLVSAVVCTSLAFTSCADWFQGKVNMDTDTEAVDLTTLFTYKGDTVELEAPEQVFVSQGIYADKIEIRWKEVENATSYIIERAIVTPDENGVYNIPEDESFEVLNKYVYSTKYEDKILKNASSDNEEYAYKFYYRVSAENIGKGYASSVFSKLKNDSVDACGWLYTPPRSVVADKGKSIETITVKWDPVEDTDSYKIYRTEKENGTGLELIDTVSGMNSSYSNEVLSSEQGKEFYFKVVAVNSYGQDSAYSAIAMGYSLKEGAPAAPDNVKVIDGFGKSTKSLVVSWDAVSPATASITITYNVYRSSSVDSVFSLVKPNLATNSFTDSSNLKPGVYYYYYIMTVATDSSKDNAQLKSGFSASGPESENPAYGFLLSPPSVLSVKEDDSLTEGNVILRWKPALGSELVSEPFTYNAYKSNSLTSSFTLLEGGISSNVDDEGYISIEVKKYNYYKVTTVNSSELESSLSSATAPHPSAPTNIVASKNEKLDSNFTPNANEVYPVKITWDAPENETPAAYTVYRSVYPDRDFRKVATVTDTECIDNNPGAKARVFYYYKVVSLNIQNEGSHSNDPALDKEFKCRGYGAITRDQWFREFNRSIMHSQSKLTLMHKSNDLDKVGTETINGDIGGTLTYKSAVAGLGAEIKMPYTGYSDFYCGDNGKLYIGTKNSYSGADSYSSLTDEEKAHCVEFFILTGNTDTKCNMSANGNMSNTVRCTGMYPGYAIYDNIKISGGAAGGGFYLVGTSDLNGNTILDEAQVSWLIGEEPTGYNWGQ